jgi:hypothetical protein
MSKLNLVTPSLVLIIVCFAFFTLYQCESGKRKDLEHEQGKRLHKEQVQKLEDSVRIAGVRIKELQAERVKLLDSVKVAVTSKKREIQTHEETTEKLRPEVAARLDSVPVLKAFVGSLESTIQKQKSLIQTLELSHSAEIVNLEEQLKESAKQIVKEREIAESWRLAAVESEKNVKKERRKKNFFRTTTAILAGGVLFLTLSK